MSEWQELKLGDFADISSSKRIFYKEYTDHGVPFYRSKEIIEKYNKKDVSTELHISEDRYNEIKEKFGVPEQGDILLTSVGTLGIPYVVQKNDKFYFKDGNLTWLKNIEPHVSRLFLYYWIISPIGKQTLDSITIGSTQPALTISGLKEASIKLPNFTEQKAIAGVLSCLDEKIDLLRRQNKTLEAIAETLFRHTFVDNAQDYWKNGCLGDIIELHYGKGLKKADRTGSGYPVVGSSGIVDYHEEFLVEGPGIVIGRKGTLGETIFLNENFHPIDTTYFVKPKNNVGYIFTYYLLQSINFKNMNSDSAVPGLNRDIALSVEIKIPTLETIEEFESVTASFFEKFHKNKLQISRLENLVDLLLPKLMSGEIRVRYDEVV